MANASRFELEPKESKRVDKKVFSWMRNETQSGEEGLLLNNKDMAYFSAINTWGLGQCVTVIGLIVNVLNALTFVKQGMKDSVNISLFGLTISDLGSLAFHFLINLCWTPPIMNLDLPFYPHQISYFFVWVHILFARVTTGTTAWITFERCVCIVAPLKIKSIVTPRRTVTFIVVLYVTTAATIAPMFYTTRLSWMYDVGRNKSIIGVSKIINKSEVESVSFYINNILPTIFLIFIVIFTTILAKTLREKSKWRGETTSLPQGSVMYNRDAKVSKLVVLISGVFIFCYFPGAVVFCFLLIFPSMSYTGRQRNVLLGLFSILLHLEGINASANFFIYLSMSSKFKETLAKLFDFHAHDSKVKEHNVKVPQKT